MVRGVYGKWKEPFASFFSHASTKANLLVRFLNEGHGACQNAGLNVVPTIFDMSVNSVKVLKLLGATRWKPFLKFQN